MRGRARFLAENHGWIDEKKRSESKFWESVNLRISANGFPRIQIPVVSVFHR